MNKEFNVFDEFGINVFNDYTMHQRLPKDAYKKLKRTIEEGKELDLEIANIVAHEMKEWAIERGATHYTHWFQPMTGVTAEKHDAFINPTDDGRVILSLSGKELIKGEPDASSFPSGGLRATFEARGYTAWDPTSPAFVKKTPNGCILCIPTAFCSYTGEALDKKTPLLRSMEALSKQAVRIAHLFGNTDAKRVTTSVGAEQEYFLVDREMYFLRKDLVYTGRTLFGGMPPKGQEMDDHYFGVIKERVAGFMKELNEELWRLGVSAKTQHNEVAPAQHELAPIYASNNVATDHNQLVMEMMKKVAERHSLMCLLQEKPFEGINGSGKHNNWSMVTDNGQNLLDPGKKPHENLQFVLVLACILKAVDEHADLLRLSAASAGNDHRLGANEAPPAIISVYLGDQLEDVLDQFIRKGEATHSIQGETLETGVKMVPDFKKDATDRNRTSPFAFTGNKFEFRMPGSAASVANPNIVLNTIVADVFCQVADRLEKTDNFDEEVHNIICEFLKEHKRIIFNGNGYADEWVEEAELRGLPNLRTTIDAIPALITDKAIDVFGKFGVLSKEELESRAEIKYEEYSKLINIEALTMVDMAKKQILPAVMRYEAELANGANAIKTAGVTPSVQLDMLNSINEKLVVLEKAISDLEQADKDAQAIPEGREQAKAYCNKVIPAMDAVRKPADELEFLVDKEAWPFPSYGDLLFYK